MIDVTIEDKMDMAKYKCVILHSYADYNCPDFPNFEEKWAKAMANEKPYELRFKLLRANSVMNTLYIFDSQKEKGLFLKDYPSIVEQIN